MEDAVSSQILGQWGAAKQVVTCPLTDHLLWDLGVNIYAVQLVVLWLVSGLFGKEHPNFSWGGFLVRREFADWLEMF